MTEDTTRPPSRMLIVARRFWPLADDSCHRLLHWCQWVQQFGVMPSILTARWHPSWPELATLRNVPVHRLLPVPVSNWNETHFQKNVVNWISSHLSSFDVIYVDRSDSLAQVILSKANRWGKPVVLRYSPEDSAYGFAPGVQSTPVQQADIARKSDFVFTTSPTNHRQLIASGLSEQKIIRQENVPVPRIQRTAERRAQSAHALTQLSGDFVLPDRTPLILHYGHTRWNDLKEVLLSLCDLLDSGALLRTWVLDAGIPEGIVYDFLKDRGWHREILLFSGFDDLEELVQLADLAWFSNPNESMQFSLPLFVASGVPILAKESTETDARIIPGLAESTYGSPTDLALRLHRWYANRTVANQAALQWKNEYWKNQGASTHHAIWRNGLDRWANGERS